MSREYDIAIRQAKTGTLPVGFDRWALANKNGWSVAHNAALYGNLPLLEPDSDLWALADRKGWTVAHEVTRHWQLPDNFSQWGLIDNSGVSVLGYLLAMDARFYAKFVTKWCIEKPSCRTDMDWRVFKVDLPEIYNRYTVNELFADTSDVESLLL